MTYTIRQADIKDCDTLSHLFVEFTGKESNINAMKKQIEKIKDNKGYYVAVACEGEQVVGTAMGIVCYDFVGECKNFLTIENVIVSQQKRGEGIGQLLMNALEDFAKENNCAYMLLVSDIKREDAHRFYRSLGYKQEAGFRKRLSSFND